MLKVSRDTFDPFHFESQPRVRSLGENKWIEQLYGSIVLLPDSKMPCKRARPSSFGREFSVNLEKKTVVRGEKLCVYMCLQSRIALQKHGYYHIMAHIPRQKRNIPSRLVVVAGGRAGNWDLLSIITFLHRSIFCRRELLSKWTNKISSTTSSLQNLQNWLS